MLTNRPLYGHWKVVRMVQKMGIGWNGAKGKPYFEFKLAVPARTLGGFGWQRRFAISRGSSQGCCIHQTHSKLEVGGVHLAIMHLLDVSDETSQSGFGVKPTDSTPVLVRALV